MAGSKGDEYWALWCEDYVATAHKLGTAHALNQTYSQITGKSTKGIATTVDRMRSRGFLKPYVHRTAFPELTDEAKRIAAAANRRRNAKVYFNVEVAVNSKLEALAEVWDVVQQLEHWDERKGEPFRYRPARMQTLGEPDGRTTAEQGPEQSVLPRHPDTPGTDLP